MSGLRQRPFAIGGIRAPQRDRRLLAQSGLPCLWAGRIRHSLILSVVRCILIKGG